MATLEHFMLLQVQEYDYFLQYVIIFCPVVLLEIISSHSSCLHYVFKLYSFNL